MDHGGATVRWFRHPWIWDQRGWFFWTEANLDKRSNGNWLKNSTACCSLGPDGRASKERQAARSAGGVIKSSSMAVMQDDTIYQGVIPGREISFLISSIQLMLKIACVASSEGRPGRLRPRQLLWQAVAAVCNGT